MLDLHNQFLAVRPLYESTVGALKSLVKNERLWFNRQQVI